MGFNDAGWASGPGQLGYGDGDEATVVGFIDPDPGSSGTQKNATTYFRTTVNVANPASFNSLSLTLCYNDSGAVYINGTQVARTSNLAAGAAYNTFATSWSADNTTQTWTLSPSVLVAGANTIAVEIHQGSDDSSDVSFDLRLTGLGQVTRGPYLQMASSSAVTVRWRTAAATDSVVWTGPAPGSLPNSTTAPAITTEHEVRVTGLQPDTKDYYAIGSTGGLLAGAEANHFLHTAPMPGTDRATRIWVLGDAGTAGDSGGNEQYAVRDGYYANLEPLLASTAGLPALDAPGPCLRLTVRKNPAATDVTFSVQASGELAKEGGWSAADTAILQNTSTLLEVRDNVPISGTPRRFMRLRITRP